MKQTKQQLNYDMGRRYFSMFTGVGGFELGLGQDFEPVGFSEIDKHASQLLKNKWPNTRNYGDATQIDATILPDFDIICGGFPCQSFSMAGKRKGFEDTRGTLFFDVARIIKTKKPKIIFLENVKGLLNHDAGSTFRIIIRTITELGYDVQWMVLNSKFHGVPQNRERVFIIGHLRGTSRPKILPFKRPNEETTREYQIERIDDQTGNDRDREANRIHNTKGITPTLTKGGAKEAKILEDSKTRWGDHYKTVDELSPTLMAIGKSDVTNIVISGTQKNASIMKEQSSALTTAMGDGGGHTPIMKQVHNMQPRSADRPSLQKNPKAGGSGHLSRPDTSYCIDTANTTAVEFNNKQVRKLTPIECEKLQGFPDNWTEGFSDTQRYKMMGNAVTVNVIKVIARGLK